MRDRHWPDLLLSASVLPMVALASFGAWFLFVADEAQRAGWGGAGAMFVAAMGAYPIALALQAAAIVLLFKQARRVEPEPSATTRMLIGAAFLSLALPVLVFLVYALRGPH